jgi:hypothetical protein
MTDAELNALCRTHEAWATREHRRWRRWHWACQAATLVPVVLLCCGAGWWTLAAFPFWWYAKRRDDGAYNRLSYALEHHRDVLQAELDRRLSAIGLPRWDEL